MSQAGEAPHVGIRFAKAGRPLTDETLKKIDAAILRLEDGSYGRCDECEQEIAAARLRALPFAVLCRDCQEQAEDRVHYEREAKAFARLQKELASVTLRTGNARD